MLYEIFYLFLFFQINNLWYTCKNPLNYNTEFNIPLCWSVQQLQMNDDAQSGIHFIVSRGSKRGRKEDRNSMGLGSTNSMISLQQTPMTRTNSVTSMLKRLFSKEDQRQPATPNQNQMQTDGGERPKNRWVCILSRKKFRNYVWIVRDLTFTYQSAKPKNNTLKCVLIENFDVSRSCIT